MTDDFDFNDYDLMDPEKIESEEAWRSWVSQSVGIILMRLDELKSDQKEQGKSISTHNGNIDKALEEAKEVKKVQNRCIFRKINTWTRLTATGAGALVAAAGGVYAVLKLVKFLS